MDKSVNQIIKLVGNICSALVAVDIPCQANPYCSPQRSKLGEMDDSFDHLVAFRVLFKSTKAS